MKSLLSCLGWGRVCSWSGVLCGARGGVSAITLLSGVGVNGKGMSVTGVGQVSSHGSLGVWGLLGGGPVLRTPAEAPRNRAGRHERLGELRGA